MTYYSIISDQHGWYVQYEFTCHDKDGGYDYSRGAIGPFATQEEAILEMEKRTK